MKPQRDQSATKVSVDQADSVDDGVHHQPMAARDPQTMDDPETMDGWANDRVFLNERYLSELFLIEVVVQATGDLQQPLSRNLRVRSAA